MNAKLAQSGKDIAQIYLERVRHYLANLNDLPILPTGAINMSAIATGANIPRQSLYKNPGIRQLLEKTKFEHESPTQAAIPKVSRPKLIRPPSSPPQNKSVDRRIHQLEQQNAGLVAENAELRRQMKDLRLQQGREDMMIESGRRILAAIR
jgi:hypothetical protein